MEQLIDQFIANETVHSDRLIAAFKTIQRTDFLPPAMQSHAGENRPLPIGQGQTNSQPETVAISLELLDVQPGQNILDVGSGSGRTSALLAHITGPDGHVTSVERLPQLCEFGKENIDKYDYISDGRVTYICGDATQGVPEHAPYDRILISAMASKMPEKLIEELTPGGIMVCPYQESLYKFIKEEDGGLTQERLPGFSFVPLISDD